MRRAFRFVIETNLTSLGQASPVISKRTSSKKLLPPISKYHHYEKLENHLSLRFWELNILRYKNILSLEAADNQNYLAKSERT